MSAPGEYNFSAVRNKRAQHTPGGRVIRPNARQQESAPQPDPETEADEPRKQSSLDPWRVAAALKARWRWLAAAAAVVAVAGFLVGYLRANFQSRVTLISRDAAATTGGNAAVQARQFTPQTLVNLMNSPELAQRVAAKSQPPVSPIALRERAHI